MIAVPETLQAQLVDRVANWWIPEQWAFVDEVPRTSVGKYDKKMLRASHGGGHIRAESAVAG